jgi:hypothetical protein
MGGLFSKAQATNELNTMINAGVSVYNTTMQKCDTLINNNNEIDIINQGNNNTITVQNILQGQTVNLNSDCVSKAAADTTISQDVTNAITQQASAIVGSLSIGSSEANNIINNSYDLSQKVINTFEQTCSPLVNNSNVLKFTSSGTGNTILLAYINQEQLVNATTKCMQDTIASSNLAQSIEQDISQSATAKNEGLLDFLKWIAIAIIAIIALIVIIVIIIVIVKAAGGGSTEVTNITSPTSMPTSAVTK